MDNESAREEFNLGKDVQDWKVAFARKDLLDSGPDMNRIVKIAYRPFDDKFTYYTGNSKGFHCRARGKLMDHYFHKDNIGLLTSRMTKGKDFAHVSVTDKISEVIYLSPLTGTNAFNFPLYLYSNVELQQDIENIEVIRKPNFNQNILTKLSESIKLKFVPEKEGSKKTFAPIDILDYIYAVLHSPKYRETYKEFLKIDFPRVPYPEDADLFWKLVALGSELRQIHLLESPVVEQFITTYPVNGNNEITRPIGKNDFKITDVNQKIGQVWINNDQYFADVPVIAWEFFIGGYQPAQKWLKDRKGRTLDHNDIFHYQKIIVALTETNRIMKAIDELDFI